MIIYQDLDGCVADFCTGFSQKVFAMAANPESYAHSKTIRKAMPKFTAKFGTTYKALSEEEVNDPICRPLLYKLAAMPGFFYDLPLLDNGVWEIVRSSGHDIKFLSAPIGDYAVADKTRWVREVLGSEFEVIVVPRAEKINHACKNSVLIDDYEKTCKEWWAKGYLAFHWRPGKEENLKEYLNHII